MKRHGAQGADASPSTATVLATWPAGPHERRLALAVVAISLAFFAVIAPQAKRALPQVWAFIPIYEAALIVSDLITALLLFGQFRIARSRAVLTLAAGYLFSALITVLHGLTFPGLFAPGGLLGAGPQSTAWLYMFWHAGFPMFVIGYALLRDGPRDVPPPTASSGRAIALACAMAAATVAVIGLAAIAGHAALPPIMQGNRYTPAMITVVALVWLTSLLALALLARRRPMSVLDLWLMVVMGAWLLDIALSAMLNGGRFDLGFYAGRVYGLLAASFVLGVLLLENGVLHARLLRSNAQERQRSADLQRLSERLELVNNQLNDSNLQLQEQTRLKSEFLANMSHELRTPLNAVIGFSEILKDGMAGDLTERQRGFAGHIHEGGHHLLALINDLLDLSKIEAGKMDLTLDLVQAEAELADALALVAAQAHDKKIRLAIEWQGTPPALRVDRRRLKQMLLNLLSNAMKFTPQGGQVILRAGQVDRARAASALPGFREGLRLPLPDGDFQNFIEISVSDPGIGIPAADLHRLFTPFSQVSNTLTRSVEGTGLGLAMVHRLADLHSGTVAVTSEPGQGSCFSIWLPCRNEPVAACAAPAAATMNAPTEQALALVVEDNAAAAALMQAQLATQGFAVRCVGSAEAALALVGQRVPDLITLDILLPGMDGWQFLARLRDTPGWDAVPVVVVSVVADRSKGFSLGAALVLQKPIGRDALAQGLVRLGLTPSGGRALTVLVIDDDAAAIELLAHQLRQCDCLVLRAPGGREGIDLARRFRPDLIALDLEMPEVNGFDVVDALKDDPSTAHIPIMVVTARNLSAADRDKLNGHIQSIVGKADMNEGWFVAEVQRALARPAAQPA